MLLELPRKEESDKFDAVELTLKFVQVKIANEGRVYASISNPAKKSDTTTQPTGQKVINMDYLKARAKSNATLGFL